MSAGGNAKNWYIDDAPKRVELLGDKTRRAEVAEHIIEFPGGAIEVARTSDGNYWAHIIINRDYTVDGLSGLKSRIGSVIESRMQIGGDIVEIAAATTETAQIAVLIRPTQPDEGTA